MAIGARTSTNSPQCNPYFTMMGGGCPKIDKCPPFKDLWVNIVIQDYAGASAADFVPHVIAGAADEGNGLKFPPKKPKQIFAAMGWESSVYTSISTYYPKPGVTWNPDIDVTIGESPENFNFHAGHFPHKMEEFLYQPIPTKKKIYLAHTAFSHANKYNYLQFFPFTREQYANKLDIAIKRLSQNTRKVDFNDNNNFQMERLINPLNNASFNDYSMQGPKQLNFLKKYKFSLAFENSIHPDHITERFWIPIRVATIPIFLGTKNIKNYFPIENSYIDASEYTPEELAKKMLYLDGNDTAYEEYFTWKRKPLPDILKTLTMKSFRWNYCRLCDHYRNVYLRNESVDEVNYSEKILNLYKGTDEYP